jgi:hypothetical protein
MQTTHSGRQTNTSKTATTTEKTERKTLIRELDENANYLEVVANRVAVAAGDVNAGISVVTRIGFQVDGKGVATRIIGVVETGVGWAHVHEAKGKKGYEGHVWEGGVTTAKGTPPTSVKGWTTLEADCIFYNIPSGTIIGYHHANVMPVAHTVKTSGAAVTKSAVSKTASLVPASKGNHPMIDFNNANPYTFGEWRYVVIP